MQIIKAFSAAAIIVSIFAPKFAHGETVAQPIIVVLPPPRVIIATTAPAPAPPSATMLEALKAWQKIYEDDKKWQDEISKDYQKVQAGTATPPRGNFTPATDSGPFSGTAKECGEAKQRECAPANFGGRTMCGLAVAKMIQCMSGSIGGSSSCSGGCGHGKDFVACSNGQMEKCGYAKVSDPKDPRCKQAGAVLSYSKSPTARGSMYGHVEFVCGDNKYCSVYREPHSQPWPRTPADTCWFPKKSPEKKGS